MSGTIAILHQEYPDQYIITHTQFFHEEKDEDVLGFAELELLVTDSETGRPISKAMISMDKIGRTALCDGQGKVLIQDVLSGDLMLDVIIYGYAAHSTMVHLSAQESNMLNVKMVRNS